MMKISLAIVGAAFVAFGGGGVAQAVTFTEAEPNDTFATGQDVGTVSPDISIEVLGDTTAENPSADFYKFFVEAGNFLTLTVKAPGGPDRDEDPVLGLLNPDGEFLDIDDDSGDGYNSLINNFRIESSGLYAAAVSRYGDFNFNGVIDDDEEDPIATNEFFTYQFQASAKPVPEPSSVLGALMFGAFGAGWMLKRRHRKKVVG